MELFRQTQEEVNDLVVKALKEFGAKKEDIKPYDELQDDLGIDSVDMAEIGMALEDVYQDDEICDALFSGQVVYVTDVTKTVCDTLEIPYQQPPRVVAHSNKEYGVKANEHQNPGRE